jgi:hypothetical protein
VAVGAVGCAAVAVGADANAEIWLPEAVIVGCFARKEIDETVAAGIED